MRIRAAVAEGAGSAPRIEELELAEPGPGELRVRMEASGVCHSDLHVRDGDWERPGPIVLGHEGAGIVEAVGQLVDPGLVGRRVVLNWNAPCLLCAPCQRGRQWLCEGTLAGRHLMPDGTTRLARPDGTGVLAYCGIGTFAEAQVVPAVAAVPVPGDVPADVAALIGCGVATGVGAILNTAAVEPGATVAVIGLGGVGLSAVMGAVLAGAGRIVAVDVERGKLELAGELGATHWVHADPATPEATLAGIRQASGEGGPDVVVEAAGRPATIEIAIAALPPGGTAVLVGLPPYGEAARFEVYPFVGGGRRILGSNYGSVVPALDFPRIADAYLAGRLPLGRLVDRHLALDELEEALARLRRREAVRQVVLFPGAEIPLALPAGPGGPAGA